MVCHRIGQRLDSAQGRRGERVKVELPEDKSHSNAKLQVLFQLDPRERRSCNRAVDQQLWGTIHADSQFDLHREAGVDLPDLRRFQVGYPFCRPPGFIQNLTTEDDIVVKFKLDPISTNSGLDKTVVYLNNVEVYSTDKQEDEYTLEYDKLTGVQQVVKITSSFKDGSQSRDQLIIDSVNIQNEKRTNSIINRGRRVLGISSGFSLLDLFRF